MELKNLSLIKLVQLLESKELSARECVGYFIDRIEKINPKLNAFVATDFDAALAKAKEIDEKRAFNRPVGILGGIPFGVKDLEDAIGFRTTRGSQLYASSANSQMNSFMVDKFTAQGAIVIGKTNTPEFGWKSDTDNAVFGPTRNPFDLSRSPGGSSGGSAAAVASSLVPFATGSDGGGSLRIPASACGISTLKTTLGRIPSISPTPGGWSDLSVRGPLARDISDTAFLLDLVVMPDQRDFRSQGRKFESWAQEISLSRAAPKVAFSRNLGYSQIDVEVAQVFEKALVRLGEYFEMTDIDPLFDRDPIEEFYILTSSYYAKMLGPLSSDPNFQLIDIGIREMVQQGSSISATEFLRAADSSFEMNRILYDVFQNFDALVTPTTAALPPKIGSKPTINGIEGPDWVKLTYPFNMTRSPAASIFAGFAPSKLPVGLQIVGPYLGDLRVLQAAKTFEEILGTTGPNID